MAVFESLKETDRNKHTNGMQSGMSSLTDRSLAAGLNKKNKRY